MNGFAWSIVGHVIGVVLLWGYALGIWLRLRRLDRMSYSQRNGAQKH